MCRTQRLYGSDQNKSRTKPYRRDRRLSRDQPRGSKRPYLLTLRYWISIIAVLDIVVLGCSMLIIQCRIILIFVVPRTGSGSCEMAPLDSSRCTRISVGYLLSCGSRAARDTCLCYIHSFCFWAAGNCTVEFSPAYSPDDLRNELVMCSKTMLESAS